MADPTQLKERPQHDYLVCIDSDGCVFDTMEIKQQNCFCPEFVKHMGLQQVEDLAREVWEFVNLYSHTRGCNRFQALRHALDLLNEKKEIADNHVTVPELPALTQWLQEESQLGNPALQKRVEETGDTELSRVLDWSLSVNQCIAETVTRSQPFKGVAEVLTSLCNKADLAVISQTPREALDREWGESGFEHFVKVIAGQEAGTKTEQIAAVRANTYYADNNVLMVGDAPGDFDAAKANGILFFPVIPGQETTSWQQLRNEGLPRFWNGNYAGKYEKQRLDEFRRLLPRWTH